MLKCSKRANIYKNEIDTEKLLSYLKIYDLVEQTNLLTLFYKVYVDKEEYTFYQLSILMNYSESALRSHLKKVNKYIEMFANVMID